MCQRIWGRFRFNEPALAVAVPPVAVAEQLVGLRLHHLVEDRLEGPPGEPGEVERAVVPDREVLQDPAFV
ncbi:hypothetical protein [Enorma phocaeensis]|uniref:Uncharacterized protein n=1 Tax=Enorma phocaeensis TaxID=1871019 RepID=A0A921IVT0_9ACTN|nr:hypothetical protein [Enorma phocaeensis]HJG36937.1 hypothetical protein [Enorma phocaeensis]